MSQPKRSLRCAIYTRKSTDEGLDQAFNSLHAQREACEAYVKSQAGEGWVAIRTVYDDGGFSGGSMDRPALQQLLADLDFGRIDVVVVYKVDRLTRSLTDFAKIVERFEKRNVSFVSVTQSFNTTNSMGRLTLNVLLSFAQFEREVASERIRDKVAASRKKGMWMGGTVPTGYDLVNRKLVPHPTEAETIRAIFRRYLELRSVDQLRIELKAKGVVSKIRTGRRLGGHPFSRGALNCLLQSRIYIGEVVYKGVPYPGQHDGIVDRDLFNRVQALMEENRRVRRDRPKTTQQFPLTSLIFDDRGNPMTPTHGQKRGGRRYRYYVSRALIDRERDKAGSIPRVPAQPIEEIVLTAIHRLLDSDAACDATAHAGLVAWARRIVRRLEIGAKTIVVSLDRDVLSELTDPLTAGATDEEELVASLQARATDAFGLAASRDGPILTIPIRAKFRGGEHHIVAADRSFGLRVPRPDRALVKALVRAHSWLKMLTAGSARSIEDLARAVRRDNRYTRRVLRLAFLSPTLTAMILEGRQPEHVSVTDLLEANIPSSWHRQLVLFDL